MRDKWTPREMQTVIDQGMVVCQRLKVIHKPEESWFVMPKLFSEFKIKLRSYFPEMSDADILTTVARYSDADFKDLVDMAGLK